MNTEIPLVINTDQVAKRLGLSVSTLAKMRLSGDVVDKLTWGCPR
jgi:hypothetical protein